MPPRFQPRCLKNQQKKSPKNNSEYLISGFLIKNVQSAAFMLFFFYYRKVRACYLFEYL
jgi:hypothetical protein